MKDFVYEGCHLIVDALCLEGSSRLLNDLNLAHQAFVDIAMLAEMTIIEQPKVIKFPVAPNQMQSVIKQMEAEGLQASDLYKNLLTAYSWEQTQNSGVTGFTVISESHCALHTWPEKDFFTFCLYSCKPFDVEAIKAYLIKTFELDPEALNVQVIERRMPERRGY